MIKEPYIDKLMVLLILCYSSIILLLDYILPMGALISAFYSLIIFFSAIFFSSKKHLLLITLLCSVFVVVGFFVSSPSYETWLHISNRVLVIVLLWTCYFIASALINTRLREKNHEKRFQIAIDAAPTAMLMVDTTGTIVLANQQMENLFGYEAKELLGMNVDFLLPERFRGHHPMFRQQFINAPQARRMGAGRDLYGRKKDGSEVPVEIGLTPVVTIEGTFVISSIIDISERKRNQNLLEKKNTELAQANEELSQFAYRTSHDLKAPLATIQGLARFIEQDMQNQKVQEAQKNLQKIIKQSEKLSTLVSDILNLTKAELEDVSEENIDFPKLIEDVKENLLDRAQENGVEILCQIHTNRTYLLRKSRVVQILENLISNSIKYCNKQKEKRYVQVQVYELNQILSLKVEDNGVGIPVEHQSHLFKMFRRFHSHLAFGSGLGMYIIKKHVDKLGGDIKVISSESGTSITISFPVGH